MTGRDSVGLTGPLCAQRSAFKHEGPSNSFLSLFPSRSRRVDARVLVHGLLSQSITAANLSRHGE